MRIHLKYILLLLFFSCREKNTKNQFVLKDSNGITTVCDIVYYNKQPYNGILLELDPVTGDTLSSQQFSNGQMHGISRKWYANHQLMEFREYKNGRKNGKQIAFWPNGNKRFEFTAKMDACEGEMKEWSINGHLFHLAHYVNGQEEGSQKMWYENGKIRANYVIINGKRYGLLGTKNCRNVSDLIFSVK